MALRDQIRAAVDAMTPPLLPVPSPELPQWDGQIFVRRISVRELAACYDVDEDEDLADERARFVALVAADANGSRIFFEDQDVFWLSTNSVLMPLIERLYWAGREHSGLTEENRKALRKNSAATAGSGSPCSCAGRTPAVESDSDSTGDDFSTRSPSNCSRSGENFTA